MKNVPVEIVRVPAATVTPSLYAWLGVAWESLVGLAALGAGGAYLVGTSVTEWLDGEYETGRTGRLGLVMRVPAPVWAWVAVGIGVAFLAFAFRASKRASGGAVVLTMATVEGGVELAAGTWAMGEGTLVVAPGAPLDFEETDAGDDGWHVVARSREGALLLTVEDDLDMWDASALVDALAAQGSVVSGISAR